MSEQYTMTGTVKEIMDMQTFDSGFTKQEFVVTSEDQYPQDVKFECVKDKIRDLKPIEPGMRVTVAFNIRGNEYQGRYYVNLQAWRVAFSTPEGAETKTYSAVERDAPSTPEETVEDDLPF